MKLKDKLKNWLFTDEIQRINSMEKSIEDAVHRFEVSSVQLDAAENQLNYAKYQLNDAKKEVEECRKLITQIVDIGVDVGFHTEEHSWAVICIEGHPEYVKFLPLNNRDVRYVLDFLKQFQHSRPVIDSPFAFRQMVEDRILK